MLRHMEYRLKPELVNLLLNLQLPTVSVAEVSQFRSARVGLSCMGVLVGLSDGVSDVIVSNLSVQAEPGLSCPGVLCQLSRTYSGDWIDAVPTMKDLDGLMSEVDSPIRRQRVIGMTVIRDKVRWRDRISQETIEISTDLGLLLTLDTGGRLLVLAKDSEAGLLSLTYLTNEEDVSWWMSCEGVDLHWAFNHTDEGQQVELMERVQVQIS